MRRGQPRFVIVRRDEGFEAQLWSGSRLVWATQPSYNRRRDARNAIDIMIDAVVGGAVDTTEDVDDRTTP